MADGSVSRHTRLPRRICCLLSPAADPSVCLLGLAARQEKPPEIIGALCFEFA